MNIRVDFFVFVVALRGHGGPDDARRRGAMLSLLVAVLGTQREPAIAMAKENLVHIPVHNFPCWPPSPFICTFILSAKIEVRRFITSTALLRKNKTTEDAVHQSEFL